MPYSVAEATGASGTVALTITGKDGYSIRVRGFVAGTTDTGAMTAVPNVQITNVQDSISGTAKTVVITPPQGGVVSAQPRGIHHVPGGEYEFPIAGGASTTLTYVSGIATGAPQIMVWFGAD